VVSGLVVSRRLVSAPVVSGRVVSGGAVSGGVVSRRLVSRSTVEHRELVVEQRRDVLEVVEEQLDLGLDDVRSDVTS